MMRLKFCFLILLALTACSAQVQTQVNRPDSLNFPDLEFEFPQVAHLTLANGIEVYLREDHDLPLVEITAMVGGGSVFDPPDMTGLSDLFVEGLQTGGAGAYSPEQLEENLDNMAADLAVSSSD